MRRLIPALVLAALSLACTPQNQLTNLPVAPTASNAPSAAPGGTTPTTPAATGPRALAPGMKLTFEHKVSSTGSTTVDTYRIDSMNPTSAAVTLDRMFNGKQDIRGSSKTLSFEQGVLWPDFSRLQAGEFSSGFEAANAGAVTESVTVGAGTFTAKKLTMDGTRKRTYWIAGTYLLKATTESSTESTTTELLKIE